VEEPLLLPTVHEVVGGVEVEDQVLRRGGVGGDDGSFSEILKELGSDTELAQGVKVADADDDANAMKDLANQAPIVRFVNLVLYQAVQDRASDIHFEPFEDEFKIRYRVDGALYEMAPPPKHLALPVTSRLKVMANLNISERRLPQDGRISLNLAGRQIDLRVSSLPTHSSMALQPPAAYSSKSFSKVDSSEQTWLTAACPGARPNWASCRPRRPVDW
jgi:type IV pilus assembly protein PilB